jgi:hypothetical protein
MYQDTIREMAAQLGFVGANPRWIEAWMRLEHPTLDGLGYSRFKDEVGVAIECIAEAGPEQCESLAKSYGL